jgi:hypothetical protein
MFVPSPIGAVKRIERINEDVWLFGALINSQHLKRRCRATIEHEEREGGAWDVNNIRLLSVILQGVKTSLY